MLRSRTLKSWWLLLVPALVLLMGFRQAPLVDPPPIEVPAGVSSAKVSRSSVPR